MGKKKAAAADGAAATVQSKHEGDSSNKPAAATAAAPPKAKKAPSQAAAAAASEPGTAAQQPSSSGKKRAAKDEIDAIFSASKKKQQPEAAAAAAGEQLAPELQQLAAEVGAARQAAQVQTHSPCSFACVLKSAVCFVTMLKQVHARGSTCIDAGSELCRTPSSCSHMLLLLLTLQASAKRPKVEGSKDDIFGEQTGTHTGTHSTHACIPTVSLCV
jgi:hypothetical protein